MSFERAIVFVLNREGGYINHPSDPGGATNFGISQRAYPNLDIKRLTREKAVEIYRKDYWEKSGANKLLWPLSFIHFDSAVNAGPAAAARWLEQSGGHPMVYLALRLEFYTKFQTWEVFGAGWTRRITALMMASSEEGR